MSGAPISTANNIYIHQTQNILTQLSELSLVISTTGETDQLQQLALKIDSLRNNLEYVLQTCNLLIKANNTTYTFLDDDQVATLSELFMKCATEIRSCSSQIETKRANAMQSSLDDLVERIKQFKPL